MKKFSFDIIKQQKEIIIYIVLGVLTTIVNYLVYIPCLRILNMTASSANIVAWVVAVLFAYLTNKPFVFHSTDWSVNTILPESMKFVGTRLASGILETAILFVTVDLLHWNGVIWKLFTSVFVVIVNYVGSKFLVFNTKA